jgi:3-phosphoshikimate 1-carboxyvinyltransferase
VSDAAHPERPRRIEPFEGPVHAVVRPPGSKSITNRALLAAALADGESRLDGILLADDTEAMAGCVAALGADLDVDRVARRAIVRGLGGRPRPGPADLDAGLSGTTSRFVLPVLALGVGPYRLDGGPPLRRRPMGPVLDAVRALGAEVAEEDVPGHLPVTVRRSTPPSAGPVPHLRIGGDVSSQFTSGLLLAGPCLPGGLVVELVPPVVSQPYLDMTVSVMGDFGAVVHRPEEHRYEVGASGYQAGDHAIEPDASAASYFFAAAVVTGGTVRVEGLSATSRQGDVRFVDVLERMGAHVVREPDAVTVRAPSGPLRGVEADFSGISDTAQTLACVAVFAEGPTRVTGIGFIRAKETDRIAAVVTELRRCGIEAHEEPDGFVVVPGVPRPAEVQTYDDHRMAMSFALLALRAPGVTIADPGCVAKTFPDYFDVLESLRPPAGPPVDGARSRP